MPSMNCSLYYIMKGKFNVNTPICTALINIASAALGRNLRLEGRTLERLGEDILECILQDKKENLRKTEFNGENA